MRGRRSLTTRPSAKATYGAPSGTVEYWREYRARNKERMAMHHKAYQKKKRERIAALERIAAEAIKAGLGLEEGVPLTQLTYVEGEDNGSSNPSK